MYWAQITCAQISKNATRSVIQYFVLDSSTRDKTKIRSVIGTWSPTNVLVSLDAKEPISISASWPLCAASMVRPVRNWIVVLSRQSPIVKPLAPSVCGMLRARPSAGGMIAPNSMLRATASTTKTETIARGMERDASNVSILEPMGTSSTVSWPYYHC